MTPFYLYADGAYRPQQAASGAWNRSHQNGVAISGLLMASIEELLADGEFQIARVSVDILRGVPLGEVRIEASNLRKGRHMRVVDAALVVDGTLYAQASATCLRLAQSPEAPESALCYPAPGDVPERPITSALARGWPVETTVVRGDPRSPGPGAYWTRFNSELIGGRPMSPNVRAVMAADLASAPSSVLDRTAWSYANVDLSVYFTRSARGDWLLIECETVTAGNGLALVSSILADGDGPFARANQTLFVASRT